MERSCLDCGVTFDAPERPRRRYCPSCAPGPEGRRCACGCGFVSSREFLPHHQVDRSGGGITITPEWQRYLEEFDAYVHGHDDPGRIEPRLPAGVKSNRRNAPSETDPLRPLLDLIF